MLKFITSFLAAAFLALPALAQVGLQGKAQVGFACYEEPAMQIAEAMTRDAAEVMVLMEVFQMTQDCGAFAGATVDAEVVRVLTDVEGDTLYVVKLPFPGPNGKPAYGFAWPGISFTPAGRAI